MRIDVTSVLRLDHAEPAEDCSLELRASPSVHDRQTLVRHRVTTEPSSRVEQHVDWFGTTVEAFGVRAAHGPLEIHIESSVDVRPAAAPAKTADLAALDVAGFRDPLTTWLAPTPRTTLDDEEAAAVEAEVAASSDVLDLIARVVHVALAWPPPSAPDVDDEVVDETPVDPASWSAHRVVAALREARVPARLVRGLVVGPVDTQAPGADGWLAAPSRFWVEAAVPGHGWWEFDPALGTPLDSPATADHLRIAHGRDGLDLPTLRGVFVGQQSAPVAVEAHARRVQQQAQQQQ